MELWERGGKCAVDTLNVVGFGDLVTLRPPFETKTQSYPPRTKIKT